MSALEAITRVIYAMIDAQRAGRKLNGKRYSHEQIFIWLTRRAIKNVMRRAGFDVVLIVPVGGPEGPDTLN